jgi:hypothetical protein
MGLTYTDREAAQAVVNVIGSSRWEAVTLAHGYLAMLGGTDDDSASRAMFSRGTQTLRRSRELIERSKSAGFLGLLPPRTKIGSAENPITKLFPATITEQRFLELLDELHKTRPSIDYSDDRESGHTLTDFTLKEDELRLPLNVKNAGTRFLRSQELVGIEPDDCIPIPAYKAHAALETVPNLLYVVSVDYSLVSALDAALPRLFTKDERIVWELLNSFSGALLRSAEDAFILTMVRKYWDQIRAVAKNSPFHVISARKSVRLLQTQPKRTPGIGLRAWGTGASAEVNVHISIKEDTTPWEVVSERLVSRGVVDILGAVNRKRVEEVYDPEI